MNTFGEKEILTDALDMEKSVTSVYNSFANECAHPQLRDTMMNILKEEHDIQFDVFSSMHQRGYYPTPAAEEQKISQVKQTHSQEFK